MHFNSHLLPLPLHSIPIQSSQVRPLASSYSYLDLEKTDSRPKTRTKRLRLILDPTSEIGSPKVDSKSELTQIEPPEILCKVAYFCMISVLDQKAVDPIRTKVHPVQTEPTQNVT